MKLKRILLLIFVLLLVIFGCRGLKKTTRSESGEIRAAWISYIELSSILDGRPEADYAAQLDTMFENLTAMNFNTVYVHASAFTDAFYPSAYYPYSEYVAGSIGADAGYDPFAVMLREAKKYKLQVEAWINPMRSFRTDQEAKIPKTSIIGQWLADPGKRGTYLVEHQDRWYLNPCYDDVRELICSIAREITENYDIDGLHMDDYFYPDGVTEPFDALAYRDYQASGGKLSLGDWRRDNINQMVRSIYSTVKKIRSSVRVGISPAGNIEYSTESIYGDVREWIQNDGYLDYIAPQIYFGYEHGTLPFDECLAQWEKLVKGTDTDLIVGLAAYKINTVDNYAKDGKYEWQEHTDILKRQIELLKEKPDVRGFAVFSYNSLFKPDSVNAEKVSAELENIRELMLEGK